MTQDLPQERTGMSDCCSLREPSPAVIQTLCPRVCGPVSARSDWRCRAGSRQAGLSAAYLSRGPAVACGAPLSCCELQDVCAPRGSHKTKWRERPLKPGAFPMSKGHGWPEGTTHLPAAFCLCLGDGGLLIHTVGPQSCVAALLCPCGPFTCDGCVLGQVL